MSRYPSSIGSDLTRRLDWNADGRLVSEGHGAAEDWPDRWTKNPSIRLHRELAMISTVLTGMG